MRIVQLGDVVSINPRLLKETAQKKHTRVSFLPMAGVSEEGKITTTEERELGEVVKGYSYFEKGDVLLAKITPCFEKGKSALVDDAIPHQMGFGSTEFHVLRANENIDPRYLFYLVWNPAFRFVGERNMTGTAGQKRIPVDFLRRYKIPLPPLAHQKRIAAILDKADIIRRKRQAAIKLTDDFLRATFLDMFGDPVTNPKGWERKGLNDVGVLARGKSKHRPRNDPELLGGPYPLIQTGEIANSDNYITQYNRTYSELGLKQSKLWPAKTLCITIAANIADTAILTFDACFPYSVVGFIPNDLIKTEYIHMWLTFYQNIIREKAPESAPKNINLKILSELKIPIPPIAKQKIFVACFEYIENLKKKMRGSEGKSNDCFNSLTQRAFRGEL